MKSLLKSLAVFLSVIILAGCGAQPSPDVATATPTPIPTASPTPTPVPDEVLKRMAEEELRAIFDATHNALAAGAWYTAVGGDKPEFYGDGCYSSFSAPEKTSEVFGGLFSFAYLTDGKISLVGSGLGGRTEIEAVEDAKSIGIGANHLLIAHADGSVTGYGNATFDKLNFEGWQGIESVCAGLWHSVGLTKNNTVVAVGDNTFNQCGVASWTGITAVSAGLNHTVGLKSDGTVVAVGDNTFNQCDVGDWTDIIAVSCGANHTVGLKNDFTLVAVGDNRDGQCQIEGWTNVVAVSAGAWHTAALLGDGSLLFCGSNSNGQAAEQANGLLVSEYCYGIDSENGPWSYVSEKTGVLICYDTAFERIPIRADLFATAGNLPFGAFADCNPDASARQLPAAICRQNDVVFAQTSDYVGFGANKKGVMMRNGVLYYDKSEIATMAFFPDGSMRVFEKAEKITSLDLIAAGVENSFSFGPILVKDGQVHQDVIDTPKHSPCPRCAIGMIEPYHFLSIVSSIEGKLTLGWLSEQFVAYGCQVAYNLDGGNSSTMVFMGEQINLHRYNYNEQVGMRALSDVLAFGTSTAVPSVDDPYNRKDTINGPR